MKNRPKVHLTFITENQTQKSKAEELAEILVKELGERWTIARIEKYRKFDQSFKIEIEYIFLEEADCNSINLLAISTSDKIAAPWLVYFDNFENTLELIFNKDTNTRFRRGEFDVIKWGHWQTSK